MRAFDENSAEFNERLAANRRARMAKIDALSPDLRALVHEEGWHVIDAFLQHGVKRAKSIRHLITVVRHGSFDAGHNPSAIPTPRPERREG